MLIYQKDCVNVLDLICFLYITGTLKFDLDTVFPYYQLQPFFYKARPFYHQPPTPTNKFMHPQCLKNFMWNLIV
jgi:hypothetical protein